MIFRAPTPADRACETGQVSRLPRAELRAAGLLVGVLAVVGAPAGWVWQAWAPRTVGLVTSGGLIPDEKESFMAGDGRFLLITGAIGVVAALLAWTRRSVRGPVVPVGLLVGGLAGAALTDLVGRLTGGGTSSGTPGTLVTPPVRVHAPVFLLGEAALALFVYGVCAVASSDDDLGRVVADPAPHDEPVPAVPQLPS